MRIIILLSALLVFAGSCSVNNNEHAHSQSPYTGEEKREIKALSDGDIKNYLEGNGMGFAKAAELNGVPGPKHILENESKLDLSPEQKQAIQNSFEKMKEQAVNLGRQIVENEKQLESLFRQTEITSDAVQAQTRKIAELQGNLRNAHLEAHLEMKKILSPQQVEKYNRLRGYTN